MYHLAQGGKVERAARVNARHHHRHLLELVGRAEIVVAEDEITGHQSNGDRKYASQQHSQGLRQRLGPQLEIGVEEHQRDGDGHAHAHQVPLDGIQESVGFRALLRQETDGGVQQREDYTYRVCQNHGADFLRPFISVEKQNDQDGEDEISR